MKRKIDPEQIVHWIIAISVALGAFGLVVQLIRYGGLVEPGNTGNFGSINPQSVVAQSHPALPEVN